MRVHAFHVGTFKIGRQHKQAVGTHALGVFGVFYRLRRADRGGHGHKVGPAIEVFGSEFGEVSAFLRSQTGELTRAAVDEDTVDAGFQHGVDMYSQRVFVNLFAVTGKGGA